MRTEPSMNRALYFPPGWRLPGIPLPRLYPLGRVAIGTQFVVPVFGHDQKLLAKKECPIGFMVQPSFGSGVVAFTKVSPPAVSAHPMVLLVPSVIATIGIPLPLPLLYRKGPRYPSGATGVVGVLTVLFGSAQ